MPRSHARRITTASLIALQLWLGPGGTAAAEALGMGTTSAGFPAGHPGLDGTPGPHGWQPSERAAHAARADEFAGRPATENDYTRVTFGRSVDVDNVWFPLVPGTQLVYVGTAIPDGQRVERRVVFTVTDLVKVIDGVPSRVVWERDFNDGRLVEAELAFFAQDDKRNVWQLGQYPEEYDENGDFEAAPAWFAGVQAARPGIAMRAQPRKGTSDYAAGIAPAVDFTDRSRVHKTEVSICVGGALFDNAVVIHETAQDEPDAAQVKFYAPGVGNVRVDWTGSDPEQEELELVAVQKLRPRTVADVRGHVRQLEASGYEHSPEVYGRTLPLRPAAPESGRHDRRSPIDEPNGIESSCDCGALT